MSDSSTESRKSVQQVSGSLEGVAKRRGRKPKARHDVDAAPVDGYGDKLSIEGKLAGFAYGWASDRDLQRYKRYGATELREGDRERPTEWCGDRKAGDVVRQNELTAYRIPRAKKAEMESRDWMRRQHNDQMRGIVSRASRGEGGFEHNALNVSGAEIQLGGGVRLPA